MVASFEQAKALFVEGIQCFEASRFAEAEQKFQASLALVPGRPSVLTNLAVTRIKLGRPAEALGALEQVLALEPDSADVWFHRGVALADLGRHEEALACHDKALGVEPERSETWFRRGQTLQRLERPELALASYDKAVALDPRFAQAWSNRGGILLDFKRLDEAAASFEQAIANGADTELNGYFLASARGRGAPANAPKQYVEFLFDEYAEKFDEHLVRVLNYQAHTVLIEHLEQIARRRFASALDLGCGTGLCGPLVKPMTEQLDGVDLSRNMLDKAGALGVYEHLEHADICHYLQTTQRRYDLVLSADVYIYVGDLDAVFAGVRRVMAEDGVYCFTAEAADAATDFVLTPGLRYAHSERYLRELAARHGFEVIRIVQHPIREDQRQPIAGLYAYLRLS
jgi:predicted TPR repeat methyltransferase